MFEGQTTTRQSLTESTYKFLNVKLTKIIHFRLYCSLLACITACITAMFGKERIFKNVWYDREQVQSEVSYKEKTNMDDKRIWLLSVWFIIMLHCRTENIIVLL